MPGRDSKTNNQSAEAATPPPPEERGGLPQGGSSQDALSQWEKKRKIVVREIFLAGPGTSRVVRCPRDPNLWRLDYKGVLSLLRTEAFKEKSSSLQGDTSLAGGQEGANDQELYENRSSTKDQTSSLLGGKRLLSDSQGDRTARA